MSELENEGLMKTIGLVCIVIFIICLLGCSGKLAHDVQIVPIVQAQAPPAPVGCAPELYAIGTIRSDNATILETADALEFASPVCPDDGKWHQVSYTLLYDHHVQTAMLESGSNAGAIQEMAVWAKFLTPDGHEVYLTHQYDKHQDVAGNRFDVFPFSVTLRAGTIVTLIQGRVACLPPYLDAAPCANAHKLSLVGTW